MNPLFIPTIILAGILFLIGEKIAARNRSVWLVVAGIIAAVPAIIFAAYYTKIFGEAAWLYRFRSLPFIELTGSGIGFFAGWLQLQRAQNAYLKKHISGFFIPFLTLICISAPYLKQIVLRPDWGKFENRWSENICMQSSESSCGPASAATLLRFLGDETVTEVSLARECFTSRRGTENWYLVRALRHRGLIANCVVTQPGVEHVLFPSVAGVKLKNADGSGHFIAVLGKSTSGFIIGDPLNGREVLSIGELEDRYVFTGFYLEATKPN